VRQISGETLRKVLQELTVDQIALFLTDLVAQCGPLPDAYGPILEEEIAAAKKREGKCT
jgi:hypothetical protein